LIENAKFSLSLILSVAPLQVLNAFFAALSAINSSAASAATSQPTKHDPTFRSQIKVNKLIRRKPANPV
jgi:hypothetical protein